MLRRWTCIIVALFAMRPLGSVRAVAAQEALSLHVRTFMEVFDDGMKSAGEGDFEIWDLTCTLPPPAQSPSSRQEKPFCRLLAVSIASTETSSHLFSWLHESREVIEVQPGLYRVEMNGRLSACSGLQLIMHLNVAQAGIRDIHGTMRAGTQCQSLKEFRPDRSSESRRILPLSNPGLGYQGLVSE